jgi:hypothetical protein
MKTEKVNPDTHIWLYAKNWYKKSFLFNDLRVIIGKRCALYPDDVSLKDIEIILLDIMYHHIKSEYQFNEFVLKCVEDGVTKTCLSFMSIVELKDIEGGLGEPDYSILPKSE